MTARLPIGEALNGLTIVPLTPGSVALECVVLIKEMDEDGDPSWALRYSETISHVEVIGALAVMDRHERDRFEGNWRKDEDD